MILVTGASGYVGGKALQCLLQEGFPVAAMVRDTTKVERKLPKGMAVRIADYDSVSSLKRAFKGVDTLLFVPGDGDGRSLLRHHANVIDAAVSREVASIVFISIVDIEDASPFYFTPVYRDAERRLGECGAARTILRCGLYADLVLENWIKPALATGTLSLPVETAHVAPISRSDVAMAAAAVAASAVEHAGRVYELTGPRSYTFQQIAEKASKLLGLPLRFTPCSPADYLQRAWAEMADPWPHAFSTLCRSIADGRYQNISGDFEKLTNRLPMSFESFLRDVYSP